MLLNEPPRSQWDLNFSVFGIPVRVHPMFWLISVLLGLNGGRGEPVTVLTWVLAVFISILIHELGHAFAARAHGWQPWITLYGMGGLASYQPTYRDPWSQILISFAGPAAGFLLAAIVVAVLHVTGHDFHFILGGPLGIAWTFDPPENPRLWIFTEFMLYVNIFWGLVNLLPIYPLDGGQISRHLFTLAGNRDPLRDSLWLSVVAAIAAAVYAALRLHDNFLAIFFGYFAYSSYALLQAYYGPGGGLGSGRR